MTSPKTILLCDDDASILTLLSRAMRAAGYDVRATDRLEEMERWIIAGEGDAALTDVTMPQGNGLDGLKRWHMLRPELPVLVMSAHNTLLNAARAQELGAVTFLPKPFDLHELMEALERATRHASGDAAASNEEGMVTIAEDLVLVGASPAMKQVFATLARLIGNDLTVLITGESGTGKERIARALHVLSKRKAKPFVALNMAAIPRELIESALFGHEKGAFTGAQARQIGAFEQAQGGTLFLDEIGDMPMEAQTRLLRVLQEQQVTPIGSNRSIRTELRIIAATHRDLAALVAQGAFREDLYFRLHVVPLALPPLRAHAEDIPLLVRHFMSLAVARGLIAKTLDDGALAALAQHDWPGNVRELEHLIYRLCALTQRRLIVASDVVPLLAPRAKPSEAMTGAMPTLAVSHGREGGDEASLPPNVEAYLAQQIAAFFAAQQGALPAPGLYARLLATLEKPLIRETLRATGGNQIKAAEILGLNRNTLRKKMREYGIVPRDLMLREAA